MKNLLFLLIAGVLAAGPCLAQKETDVSIPEFRQALIDFALNMDSAQGPGLASNIQALPDSVLLKWYQGVPDGKAFQAAVADLRSRKLAGRALRQRLAGTAPSMPAAASPLCARSSTQAFSSSGSAFAAMPLLSAPDLALAIPEYPSGGHWTDLTNTLKGVNALPGGDVSAVRCEADANATMSVLVSTFRGIKEAAEAICNAIPDPVVIVLGFGTRIPAKEICFGVNLIIGAFNSAAEGYLADCEAQTAMVDDAERAATYENTITLNNLELRLSAEENLQNLTNPMIMFEVPTLNGGYLEFTRSIVADIIAKMTSTGLNEAPATKALLQGDAYYAAGNWKSAFKSYQTAYGLAAN